MKLQFLAIPLLLALVLSPLVATAATGSITFSSPTSGATYTGTASYTISGTITPTPSLPDNVVITVTLKGGSPSPLDEQTVAVGSGGTFTYATNVGGSSAWTTGTYVITASDSSGATGTTTFTYTSGNKTTTPSSASMIDIYVAATSPVYSGQTVNIEAMLVWSTNGTLVTATNTTVAATLQPPTGASASLGAASTTSTRGQYYWTYALPAGSANGAYFIQVLARHGPSGKNSIGWGLGSFTVNSEISNGTSTGSLTGSQIAGLGKNISSLSASLASLTSAVSTLQGDVNTLTTNLGSVSTMVGTINTDVSGLMTSISTLSTTVSTLSTSVGSITSGISTLTTDVTSLQSTVNSLGNLSAQMTTLSGTVSSLNTTVSNEQTYILVVAALAVITLVLELAILIRKMS